MAKFLIILFLFSWTTAFTQNGTAKKQAKVDTVKYNKNVRPPKFDNDFVVLTGEVKLIDSQYILITKLAVTNDKQISVAKVRMFDQGEESILENKLYLRKTVRYCYVHVYTDGFHHHTAYNDDWDKKDKN